MLTGTPKKSRLDLFVKEDQPSLDCARLLSVKVFKVFLLSRCAVYLSIAVHLAQKGYQKMHTAHRHEWRRLGRFWSRLISSRFESARSLRGTQKLTSGAVAQCTIALTESEEKEGLGFLGCGAERNCATSAKYPDDVKRKHIARDNPSGGFVIREEHPTKESRRN